MSYEYFYPGTPYSLEPTYGNVFTGYRVPAGQLGATTSIQTANQIKEVSNLLNQGIKNIEVSTIQPEVFDSIPKQHLKEINRLSKLTNSQASVHAPLTEPSGYTREGKWDEAERYQAENQIWSAVRKSHELSPDGNIPVTVHSSAMLPLAEEKIMENGKESSKSMYIVDSVTGEIAQIKEKEKFFPEEKLDEQVRKELKEKHHLSEKEIEEVQAGKKFSPIADLYRTNEEVWTRQLNTINYNASRGEDHIDRAFQIPLANELRKGTITPEQANDFKENFLKTYNKIKIEQLPADMQEQYKDVAKEIDHGRIFLKDTYLQLKELYNRAYKEASPQDKVKLDKYKDEITPLMKDSVSKDPEKLKEFSEKVIEKGLRVLSDIQNPALYIPLNDFLVRKSSETFGNVAFNAYKEFGDKAPIVSIENPPTDNALSRAEDLKNLIEASRNTFVKRARQEGMSETQAKAAAEKLIGATWDTSHIAMLRKFGHTNQDLIKESKIIAPFVKHVHYNDNFGSAHTDLPPGMGDVPMKEIMKNLEEAGFKGAKIFEGGGFFQHFQTSPHPYVLEGSGSPLYSMKAPYWNQAVNTQGNYLAMPSAYFPEQHFSLYGGGFTTLPPELGGQMSGKSRASGTNID